MYNNYDRSWLSQLILAINLQRICHAVILCYFNDKTVSPLSCSVEKNYIIILYNVYMSQGVIDHTLI